MNITQEQVDKIKNALPNGAIAEISKSLSIPYSTVSYALKTAPNARVLNGKKWADNIDRKRKRIYKKATQMLEERGIILQ